MSVHGFAEDLPLNHNDVDFCLRLRDQDYSCVVDPTIEVYHNESTTQHGMTFAEQELLFLKHRSVSDPIEPAPEIQFPRLALPEVYLKIGIAGIEPFAEIRVRHTPMFQK